MLPAVTFSGLLDNATEVCGHDCVIASVIFVNWNWKWNGNGHIFVKWNGNGNGNVLQNGNEI